MNYILIKLHRPEGYEDVHPELMIEDAGIHLDFQPEVVIPLTNEQIDDIQFPYQNTEKGFQWLAFARAIEAAHKIKEST